MAVSDIRGNVDTIILKVLFEGDRYGYDMTKAINARGGGQWEIKQPTVYAHLKVLEKQGFISSYRDSAETGGGARKYYTLTDRGREVFITYRNEFERTRDLFSNLITDDASPVQFADDFSDVEDESYDIPKKRRSRPTKKQEQPSPKIEYNTDYNDYTEQVIEQTETAELPQEQAAQTEETQPLTAFSPVDEDEFAEQPDSDEDELISNEYVVDTDLSESDYIQPSFFSFADAPESDEQTKTETNTAEQVIESADTPIQDTKVTTAADPHELVSRIYSASATDKCSYFESSDKSMYEEDYEEPVAPAPKQPVAVAPPPPPPPTPKPIETTPAPIDTSAIAPIAASSEEVMTQESLARREYRDILGDLIERSEARQSRSSVVEEQPDATDQEVASSGEHIEVRRFSDVIANVEELGNRVEIRDHNDSARQYNRQFYYYSHRLMFTHYCIMSALMLLLGAVLFSTFRFGLGLKQRYDYILFISMGLIPIIMLIVAIIVFAADPDKKKRINVNFRFYIIIRIVIMIQAAVVVYCLNIIWGMPIGFSVAYVPSLVIPMAYAMFIPISEVIFMLLLKSERYAVAE